MTRFLENAYQGNIMILIISFDISRKGGIERLTKQVRSSLSEYGVKSVVVSPRRLGPASIGKVLGGFYFILSLWYYLPRAKKVLCMHSLLIRLLWYAGVFGIIKKPVYCWVHGIEVWGSALKRVERDLSRCQAVIASSSFTRDRMLEHMTNAPRTSIVHPTADETQKNSDRESRLLASTDSKCVLITIARMDRNERYKGHDAVIDALCIIRSKGESVNKYEWRVIGDGNDTMRLKGRVAQLELDEIVRFTGMIDDDQLSNELACADLMIMPSRYAIREDGSSCGEGFGIVYLEAAFAGIPSIACIEGGQADFIINEQTGWLVNQDPFEITALLTRLAEDRELILQIGNEARKHAVAEFGKDSFTTKLVEALEISDDASSLR